MPLQNRKMTCSIYDHALNFRKHHGHVLILVTAQRDATQNSLFTILQVHVSGVNRTHHQKYTKL
jgi:hypothetical protein